MLIIPLIAMGLEAEVSFGERYWKDYTCYEEELPKRHLYYRNATTVVVQPPAPLCDVRTSQHCVLALATGAV